MGIIFGSLIFVLAAVLAVLAVTGTQKSRSLQQEMKRMDRQISKMQKSSESLEKELELRLFDRTTRKSRHWRKKRSRMEKRQGTSKMPDQQETVRMQIHPLRKIQNQRVTEEK